MRPGAGGLAARRTTKGHPMLRYLLYMHLAVANSLRDRLDDRGATAVEYGLIVTLIAVAIIGVVRLIGVNLTGIFTQVANAL